MASTGDHRRSVQYDARRPASVVGLGTSFVGPVERRGHPKKERLNWAAGFHTLRSRLPLEMMNQKWWSMCAVILSLSLSGSLRTATRLTDIVWFPSASVARIKIPPTLFFVDSVRRPRPIPFPVADRGRNSSWHVIITLTKALQNGPKWSWRQRPRHRRSAGH